MSRGIVWEYRRFSSVYVLKTPLERYSSSRAPVHTCCPFFPTIVAVPVSWQNGRMKLAATSALRSIATATPRSLGDASGSDRIAATFSLWEGRRRKETSRIAWFARNASPSGSTFSISFPPNFAAETCSFVRRRYFVVSFPSGNGSWYENFGIGRLLPKME